MTSTTDLSANEILTTMTDSTQRIAVLKKDIEERQKEVSQLQEEVKTLFVILGQQLSEQMGLPLLSGTRRVTLEGRKNMSAAQKRRWSSSNSNKKTSSAAS